jgi:hypothetical protein
MKVRRRPRRGYNRTRAAEKRWRRSEWGRLFVDKVSRQTREEIFRNGFVYGVGRPVFLRREGS